MALFALGQGSYVGLAQQAGPTGWGGTLVAAGLKTFPNLGGDVLTPTAGRAARQSIVTAMPRVSQTYPTVSLVPVAFNFEVVTSPTDYKPLLLAAWGKRINNGSTPNYTDSYNVTNPKFDAGTDGTIGADGSPTLFYDHTLSLHVFLAADGTSQSLNRFSVKDWICTGFRWTGEANKATVFSFDGTGRNLAASASAVAFADQTGSILSWDKGANATPGGLYLDTNTSPSTLWKIRQFEFNLSQPHTFETGVGAVAGNEMFTPFRTNPPNATLSWRTFYEDAASGTDPAQNMLDFINSTPQGVIINYKVATNDYVKLQCAGTVDPAVLNNPKVGWGPNGAVDFAAELQCYPDTQNANSSSTANDLFMELGSSSHT